MLRIGALTRHVTLETSARVRQVATALAEAAGEIGYPAIRNRGTIGGSLAHADPVAELPAALMALGAAVHLEGPSGRRQVPVADLSTGFLTTSLAPAELITEVTVPVAGAGTGSAWLEHSPRSGDFALCGVAAVVTVAPDRTLSRARLTACGVGLVATDLTAAVSPLIGARHRERELLASVDREVSAIVEPPDDIRASAADRRVLAGRLATDALATAWSRAEKSLER
jgi:CO/xanthine dehydrogenase FAD-binding subunit